MRDELISLGMVEFDSSVTDLLGVEDGGAKALAHLSNADTIAGMTLSLPLVMETVGEQTILRIAPDEELPRRIAG